MFLAAIITAFALIVIVLPADHNGYIRAMKQLDRDIDKIMLEIFENMLNGDETTDK